MWARKWVQELGIRLVLQSDRMSVHQKVVEWVVRTARVMDDAFYWVQKSVPP